MILAWTIWIIKFFLAVVVFFFSPWKVTSCTYRRDTIPVPVRSACSNCTRLVPSVVVHEWIPVLLYEFQLAIVLHCFCSGFHCVNLTSLVLLGGRVVLFSVRIVALLQLFKLPGSSIGKTLLALHRFYALFSDILDLDETWLLIKSSISIDPAGG